LPFFLVSSLVFMTLSNQWWQWCWWLRSSVLLLLCVSPLAYSNDILCIDHHRHPSHPTTYQQHTRQCNKASSTHVKKATQTTTNKVYYTLHCTDKSAVCDHVNHTVRQATDILSSLLQLETPLYANVSYFSFCDAFDECTIDKSEISIGK
jgi:hypothetical protein